MDTKLKGLNSSLKGEKSNEINPYSKEWFISKSKKAKKKNLAWLDIDSLPKLHYKDNNEEIGDKELYNFINIAASGKSIIPLEEFKKFAALVKEEDLALIAEKMYETWNREAKTKWALAFVAAFGQDELIKPLKDEVLELTETRRGAIASQVLETIAMMGTTEAFQTIDWFTRKVKNKKIKEASNNAIITATKELGITKDELLDKIIPSFDFSLDFGPRQFDIKLNLNLSLKVTDTSTKKISRSLPKLAKGDNEEKRNLAVDLFKEMKKEIKNQVKIQKNRLENSFSSSRFWKFTSWTDLFLKKTIMKHFALTLVWGVYENSKLKKCFRVLENGNFIDINKNKFTIKETEDIALIHPIELSKEELKLWEEQLKDNKITQSFEQLNKYIHIVSDENKDKLILEDYLNERVYNPSTKKQLASKGWKRDSDYVHYKNFEEYGLEVHLRFDIYDGGYIYRDNSELLIKGVIFYKAESVKESPYLYDKPKKDNIFSLGQIPARLYSEVYSELVSIIGEF